MNDLSQPVADVMVGASTITQASAITAGHLDAPLDTPVETAGAVQEAAGAPQPPSPAKTAQDAPGGTAGGPSRRTRTTATASRASSRPRQTKRTPVSELTDLKTWLDGLDLGIAPTVHVNGAAFTTCVMTVDFGNPRKSVRLTTEQSSELVSRLRAATKTVMARDVKVGVMTDHSAGIWWTTIT